MSKLWEISELRANMGCGNVTWGDIRIDITPDSAATHILDLQDLSCFEDQIFDDVRCISVLEHIKDWRKALLEMLRTTRKRIIIEVPVNSDIRFTDPWRILFPTPQNIKLFKSIPERATAHIWQMDPWIVARVMMRKGFAVIVEKVFQVYCGMPSRCWRITGWRIQR